MLLSTILNVVYVLIAIAMIVLILMQRGAGAQAGSGFGAGASATVFGARGAGNFLSKSTKWLAIVFFAIALFMGWSATHAVRKPAAQAAQQDLGLMSSVPVAPGAATAASPSAVPVLPTVAPTVAPSAVPTAPATVVDPAQTPQTPTQGN